MIELDPYLAPYTIGKYDRARIYDALYKISNEKAELDRITDILQKYVINLCNDYILDQKLVSFYRKNKEICSSTNTISLHGGELLGLSDNRYPGNDTKQSIETNISISISESVPVEHDKRGYSSNIIIDNESIKKVPEEKADALKNILADWFQAKLNATFYLSEYCENGTPNSACSWRCEAFSNCRSFGRLYRANPEWYQVAKEVLPGKVKEAEMIKAEKEKQLSAEDILKDLKAILSL